MRKNIRAVIERLHQKALSPVGFVIIPHPSRNPFRFSLPLGLVVSLVFLSLLAAGYVVSMMINLAKYEGMERLIADHARKVQEFNATLSYLKRAEGELRRLLAAGSKEKILNEMESMDTGTAQIEAIEGQIETAMNTVSSIREYLRHKRELFLATPMGVPVVGVVTSPFGVRINPLTRRLEFHRGLDIAAPAGSPVRATADGVVTFSGWNGPGGNLVVLSHGEGFTTCYAHNSMNLVRVGQLVRRGDIIAYAGSTGSATGSHVHYEIWNEGRPVNPRPFLERN